LSFGSAPRDHHRPQNHGPEEIMSAKLRHLATRCAHGGASRRGPGNEPFQRPIAQSTIFDLGTSADAEAIFSGSRKGYAYSRFGNPSVEVLAELIAALEGGAGALVTSVYGRPDYLTPPCPVLSAT